MNIKVVACLVALFACGTVCGFAVNRRPSIDRLIRGEVEERWIESRLREDAARLQLSPAQIEQVRPLYRQMLVDIRNVREEAGRGLMEAAKKQGRDMWAQLGPQQRQEYTKLSEERLARWQKKESR